MEDEPELMYWKPAPKPQPVPLQLPPPVYHPMMYPPLPPPLPPPSSALCYPVTEHPHGSRQMTDNLIQEEVTRAAKTLFSKRNRTLMHWLNPDISMSQLKTEVNAAWECLPPTEKVFYISQVLGKFAPHTTSLMVNPQLDPAMGTGTVAGTVKMESGNVGPESGATTSNARQKAANAKVRKPRPPKRPVEYSSDEDASCDSGLVVDMERADGQRVKRKYTKRKTTTSAADCGSASAETQPRVKRKYVKRKLVRKKYKKREPKKNDTQEGVVTSSVPEPDPSSDPVWIELDDADIGAFKLSNEEVDSFWAAIDDPSKFFIEMEIE